MFEISNSVVNSPVLKIETKQFRSRVLIAVSNERVTAGSNSTVRISEQLNWTPMPGKDAPENSRKFSILYWKYSPWQRVDFE
jgi:hypothetical protein